MHDAAMHADDRCRARAALPSQGYNEVVQLQRRELAGPGRVQGGTQLQRRELHRVNVCWP